MKLPLSLTWLVFAIAAPSFAQNIGLNTNAPDHPAHIVQLTGTTLGSGMPVLFTEYTGTNTADVIAIKGRSKPQDFYGVGGDFEGGWMGVRARITGGLNNTYYGVNSDVAGSGLGNFYGLYSNAHGTGENYAVYGTAASGSKNWAGYFANGNVHIQNRLALGNTNPQHPVHINQPSGTTISGGSPVMHVEYTGSNAEDVIAVRGWSIQPSSTGIGGEFEGGKIGVIGQVTTSLNGVHFGVQGKVTSTSGTNVGIFGDASGLGGINYAGYFGSGDVYIDDELGVGRDPVTNRLEVNGTASKSVAGDWLANSDERLKKNIQPLESREMIEKLLALKGITYEWNDDKTGYDRPEGIHYGFTAQNIQSVFPTLVEEDKQGYLQTAYSTYDAMIIESIRYLYEQNLMLMAELKELKKSENNASALK